MRFCSGRSWRTLTAADPEAAQVSLDRFLATTGDARQRRLSDGTRSTVGVLAETEPLRVLPWAPFPATVTVERTVGANATVAFRGNRYAVPPGMPGTIVEVRHRLSTPTVEVHALAGRLLCAHRLAPPGAGMVVRSAEDHQALQTAVLAAFCSDRPCDSKANRPPGAAALAEASRLLGPEGQDVVVDLARYAEWVGVPA